MKIEINKIWKNFSRMNNEFVLLLFGMILIFGGTICINWIFWSIFILFEP